MDVIQRGRDQAEAGYIMEPASDFPPAELEADRKAAAHYSRVIINIVIQS